MIVILSIFSNIGFTIEQAIRSFIGNIAATLYGYIVDLYNVFMIIARADVLDNDYVQLIYNRVGMILGLFMIFKLSFSLIQSLIDPSKFSDKEKGFASIVKRIIISIVLLGITPFLFNAAFDFQEAIVGSRNDTNNVIYRIIVADDVINSSENFGQRLATDLFFCFFKKNKNKDFHETEIIALDDDKNGVIRIRKDYDYLKNQTLNSDDSKSGFQELVPYLSLRDGGGYVFDWDIILSLGAAIAVLWILVNYCISIAIRAIQLAYLKLISPIPILSYIYNPDGAFKKWIKQCTSTYLDLFMRLAILYFIINMCDKVMEILDNSESQLIKTTGLDPNSSKFTLVKVFLLIGLLLFGKRVPELLKDLFPGDGKFDLGIKSPKKLIGDIPGGNFAYKTSKGIVKGAGILGAGVVGGGIAGIATGIKYGEGKRGRFAGGVGGFFRGAVGSAKTKGNIFKNIGHGVGNVRAANERAYQRHHDGSTFWGRKFPEDAQRTLDEFERENKYYTDFESLYSSFDNILEKDVSVQAAIQTLENTKKSARFQSLSEVEKIKEINELKNKIKDAKRKVVSAEVTKEREVAGSGNAQMIAILRGMSDLSTKNKNLEGFRNSPLFSVDDSDNVLPDYIWDNVDSVRKKAKNSSINITQRGGTRNKEYREAQSDASYKKKK